MNRGDAAAATWIVYGDERAATWTFGRDTRARLRYFECDNPELTKDAWCKSNNGECGTSKDLDNCYYKKPNADLYIVVEAAGGGGDRKRPTLLPTMEKLPCPTLRALEFEECPIDDDEVFHFTCNDPMLEVGEICKSNNYECGTTAARTLRRRVAAAPRLPRG